MKYQNNKDLAEAQYYLKMLDDFCKSGQVKILIRQAQPCLGI